MHSWKHYAVLAAAAAVGVAVVLRIPGLGRTLFPTWTWHPTAAPYAGQTIYVVNPH